MVKVKLLRRFALKCRVHVILDCIDSRVSFTFTSGL
jgi:hypothetical protein